MFRKREPHRTKTPRMRMNWRPRIASWSGHDDRPGRYTPQEPLPGKHQPRDPDAAKWDLWNDRSAAIDAIEHRAAGLRADAARVRVGTAADHQRNSRSGEDGGG